MGKEKYFKTLIRELFNYIVILITLFFVGYFVATLVNNQVNKYEVIYESETFDESLFDSSAFLKALEKYKKDENGKTLYDEFGKPIFDSYSYAGVANVVKDMYLNGDIEISEGKIICKAKYFTNGQLIFSNKDIKDAPFNRYQLVLNKVLKYYDKNVSIKEYNNINFQYGWLYGLIGLSLGLIGVLVINYFEAKKNKQVVEFEDLYKTPFSKKYWADTVSKFRKIKLFDIVLLSILLAFIAVCKFIKIPSGFESLGVGITYLVLALACLIYGPVWGLLIGAYSDLIGFLIQPSSIFLIEYTIQAMFTCFVYGIVFYKHKLTFASCLVSRLIVNLVLNTIYGSIIYQTRYMGLGFESVKDYMLFISLPKNLIYLLPQTLLLFLVLKAVVPVFKLRNIVPKSL